MVLTSTPELIVFVIILFLIYLGFISHWDIFKKWVMRVFSIENDSETDEEAHLELGAPSRTFVIKTEIELPEYSDDYTLMPSMSGSNRASRVFKRSVRTLISMMKTERKRKRRERDMIVDSFCSKISGFEVKQLEDDSGYSFHQENKSSDGVIMVDLKDMKKVSMVSDRHNILNEGFLRNMTTIKDNSPSNLLSRPTSMFQDMWTDLQDLDDDPLKPKVYNPLDFPKKDILEWITYIVLFPTNLVYFYFFPNILANPNQKKLLLSGILLVIFVIVINLLLASEEYALIAQYQIKPHIFGLGNAAVFSFK